MELHFLALCAAFECCLLAFLEKSTKTLSNFQARKICHAGTGLMLLQLDSREEMVRYFVYAIAVVSLALTWEVHPKLKPFRFGKSRDIGMTVYLLVAVLWFSLQLPIHEVKAGSAWEARAQSADATVGEGSTDGK
eukprot:Skav224486  [mRNA]  locus=scaffold2179:79972:87313:+ [translate_table: standard]